ncbi:MAG: thiamine-phosphate kinase [Gemmatimonadaceae bacterium]
MSRHLTMGPGREFDAVRALLEQWGPAAVGIGDDGAVLDVPTGSRLVVSTDTTVEGVHFREEWLTPEEVGWRAAMAALSDLAAMGATPLGALLALTVPDRWRGRLGELAKGLGEAAVKSRVPIVGGDVTVGDRLALAITVLGHTPHPLTRGGARPGDTLYVTGALGGPGAALAAWELGRAPHPADRARFARPEARIAAGEWVAAHGAHATIDLSDGLGGDAGHLAAASGVRCVVEFERIPLHGHVTTSDALASGEEYELLVAAPELDVDAFRAATGGLALTAIGHVEAGTGVQGVQHGKRVTVPGAHDHFAST